MNFSLFGGGTAQSDTMSTLLYERWSVEGNQLTLTAKSIGNKQSSIDSKIYFIQKLNDKELVLKDKMQLLNYKKVNTKSQQKSKNLKGQLVFSHEVRTFQACGSDKLYWISDQTGKIKDVYSQLTKDQKPYTPIFVEIQAEDQGKSNDGFSAKYESVYNITNLLEAKAVTENDCH